MQRQRRVDRGGCIELPLFGIRGRLVRQLAYEVAGMFEELRFPSHVLVDSTALHYIRWTDIVFRERASPWAQVLWSYYLSEQYRRLNGIVNGNWILAKYATYHFLKKLNEKEAKGLAEEAMELAEEAKGLAEEVLLLQAFSHFGIPVERYLREPDRLRYILSNRIVVSMISLFRKAIAYPDFSIARMPVERGVPLGMKRMERPSELPKVLPQDFAEESLFSYLLATNALRVREEYGGIRGYVVYLDKSGSMRGTMPFGGGWVPKISFAAASALALMRFVKRYGGDFTLKFFDTEVHDEVRGPEDLIESLLRIKAEEGTNVTEVLRDARRYEERRIFVVTDGIDEVDENVVKSSKHLDITFIFIKTDNEILSKYFRCVRIERVDPQVLLKV
ncbi:MAG: hypothetical protein QXK42_03715 [Candidatus Korarchaeum sp.]